MNETFLLFQKMNTGLRIGNLQLSGDQIISVLVGYGLLEPLLRGVLIDTAIKNVELAPADLIKVLPDLHPTDLSPEQFGTYLTDWCTCNQIEASQFEWNYLRNARIEKFKQLVFVDRVEAEFVRRKLDLDQVEYSMIRVRDPNLAQELFLMIRDDGVEFEQLARQYSEGSERESAGYMGTFALSQVPTAFLDLFRIGVPKQIWNPIQLEDWAYLIRLERLRSASFTDAMRVWLIDQLYAEWLQVQVTTLLTTPNAIAIQPLASTESSVPSELVEMHLQTTIA